MKVALQLGQGFKILATTNGGVRGWIAVDMGGNDDAPPADIRAIEEAGGQTAIEADMDGETNTIESQ